MTIYAFPNVYDPNTGSMANGMTLRDYFAARAMQVEMAGHPITNNEWKDEVAKNCYEMADAMMKAREL